MRLLPKLTSGTLTMRFGPFVDQVDGYAPETGLTITQALTRLSKNGGAFAQKADTSSATHDENGWYAVTFNSTDLATLGELVVAFNVTGALPVWERFMVVPQNVYNVYGTAENGSLVMKQLKLAADDGTIPLDIEAGATCGEDAVRIRALRTAKSDIVIGKASGAGSAVEIEDLTGYDALNLKATGAGRGFEVAGGIYGVRVTGDRAVRFQGNGAAGHGHALELLSGNVASAVALTMKGPTSATGKAVEASTSDGTVIDVTATNGSATKLTSTGGPTIDINANNNSAVDIDADGYCLDLDSANANAVDIATSNGSGVSVAGTVNAVKLDGGSTSVVWIKNAGGASNAAIHVDGEDKPAIRFASALDHAVEAVANAVGKAAIQGTANGTNGAGLGFSAPSGFGLSVAGVQAADFSGSAFGVVISSGTDEALAIVQGGATNKSAVLLQNANPGSTVPVLDFVNAGTGKDIDAAEIDAIGMLATDIEAKTDNLPADPASETNVDAVEVAVLAAIASVQATADGVTTDADLRDLMFNRDVITRHPNQKPSQYTAGTGLNQITVNTTQDGSGNTETETVAP